MAPRFNTQKFLSEMRSELLERHETLVSKVDAGFEDARTRGEAMTAAMAAHELADTKQFGEIDKRLEGVENTGRLMRWLGATMVGALIVGLVDFLFVHLPKLLVQ